MRIGTITMGSVNTLLITPWPAASGRCHQLHTSETGSREDTVALARVVDVRVERAPEPHFLDHEERGNVRAERDEEVAQGGSIERRCERVRRGDVGVDVERGEGPDEPGGEKALGEITPGGVDELLHGIADAHRPHELRQIVEHEPGAVVDVAHQQIDGHDEQYDDDGYEDDPLVQPWPVANPQLTQGTPAHEQLEDDRERNPDDQVERLPVRALAKIEDEPDRDPPVTKATPSATRRDRGLVDCSCCSCISACGR